MRAVQTTRYAAFDGTMFDTTAECRNYEREKAQERLVGLTIEDITAAIDRTNPSLGDAIERVAYLVAEARKAAGEFKRKRAGEQPEQDEALPLDDEGDIADDTTNSADTTSEPDEPAEMQASSSDEIPQFLRR